MLVCTMLWLHCPLGGGGEAAPSLLVFPQRSICSGSPTLHDPLSQRPVFWSAVVQVPEKDATSQASVVVLHRRHGARQLLELQVTCTSNSTNVAADAVRNLQTLTPHVHKIIF